MVTAIVMAAMLTTRNNDSQQLQRKERSIVKHYRRKTAKSTQHDKQTLVL